MQVPKRNPESKNKLIDQATIDKVLAQKNEKAPEEETSRMISLKIPTALLDRLDAQAKKTNITRSAYIKMALTSYLDANEPK